MTKGDTFGTKLFQHLPCRCPLSEIWFQLMEQDKIYFFNHLRKKVTCLVYIYFLFQSFFCELVIDLHTEQSNHNYLLLYTLNPPITTIYCFIYHSPCSLFPCQIFYLLSLCVYSVFSLLHICSEESKLTIKLNLCHKKQKMACQPIEKAKPKHRKGLWSPEEDNKLRNYILKHGHGCWSAVPIKAGEFLFLFPHYVPLSFILIAYS